MLRRAVTLLLCLVLLTSCEPRGSKPSNGGWDGTKFTKCDVPGQPPPGKVSGPVRGMVHILIVITADVYRPNPEGGRDICSPNIDIPFKFRLWGTLDRQPAIKLERGRALPWTANLITPHFEHLYVPLTAAGKIWEVTVHAIHEEKNVFPESIPRSYIRCSIFVDGNRAARHSARIKLGLAIASCSASGPVS